VPASSQRTGSPFVTRKSILVPPDLASACIALVQVASELGFTIMVSAGLTAAYRRKFGGRSYALCFMHPVGEGAKGSALLPGNSIAEDSSRPSRHAGEPRRNPLGGIRAVFRDRPLDEVNRVFGLSEGDALSATGDHGAPIVGRWQGPTLAAVVAFEPR